MNLTMKVLVVGASRFDGEVEGRKYRSSKIVYIPDEQLVNQDKKGHFPATVKADYDLFEKIVKQPAFYEMEFVMRPSKNGIDIQFIDAKLLQEANIFKNEK